MAKRAALSMDEPAAAFDLATGQDACERLLSIDGLPPEVDRQTRRKMAELAPALDAIAPSARSWPLRIAAPDGWTMHGASIASADDGFRMTAQSSNRVRKPDLTESACDGNCVARTRNFWVELNAELEIRTVQAVLEHERAAPQAAIPDSGVVDARPVAHDGAWWIVGAAGHAEGGQSRQLFLGRLDGPWLQETVLLGDAAGDAVWNPVAETADGALRCVASVFPTVVAHFPFGAGKATRETRHAAPLITRELRATTQAVPCDGGSLCLAYESVVADDGRVQVVHRWLWLDEAWHVSRLSRPFRLSARDNALAAGLTRRGDDLVVSFGTADGDVWVGTVGEHEVVALLKPPLELDLAAVNRHMEDDPMLVAPLTMRHRDASPGPRPAPTIAAMTITGSRREIIGDALRSVSDWVDWFVLIDTGIADDSIEVARAVAGDRLIVREFPWCDDFSAARNFALAAAAETGADWAVFVDTDERLMLNGVDIHAALAASPEPALLAPILGGHYMKDRFFRLPVRGAFRGPTHEAFFLDGLHYGATICIPGVVFDELPKSAERLRHKDERDREILRRYTAANPDQPRWWYYLGDALARLGQFAEAETAFRACSELRGWDEESGWAMYRAAECLIALGRLEEAREAAITGMMRHPGLADLSWQAADISLRLDQPLFAVYWARQSIALGLFAGIGPSVHRAGWRNPVALWEGPYAVLREALAALGDRAGAREAARSFRQARAARCAQPAQG